MKLAVLALSFSLLAFPAFVTPCVAQERTTANEPKFVLDAGEIQLSALIDRAATYLQWNILTNQAEMATGGAQPTKLQQRIETDRPGCEELLTSLLYRAGFAVLPIDEAKRVYEVIAMNGPRGREIAMRAVRRTPAEVLARPTLLIPVTTTVTLKHINAMVATNALRPFFASTGGPTGSLTIGNVGNNSGMVISGLQDQVANVLRMLETCDVPPPPDATPPVTDLIEALTKRVEALEKKLAATQPQAR